MKKVFSLALLAGMFAFVACGPSKEQQEATEKAKQDSIAMAMEAEKAAAEAQKQQAMQDSINAANAAAKEKATQDSIAAATSKGKKGKSK